MIGSRSSDPVRRIGGWTQLFGAVFILGPVASYLIRVFQGLPPLPTEFSALPPYNPSVLGARFPLLSALVSGLVGSLLIVTGTGFRQGRRWALRWLTTICQVGMVMVVVLGVLWIVSALPVSVWPVRAIGVGAIVVTPLGCYWLWRLLQDLHRLEVTARF